MHKSIVKTISLQKGLYRLSALENPLPKEAAKTSAQRSLIVIPLQTTQNVVATFLSATRDFALLTVEDNKRILQVNMESVDFHIVSLAEEGLDPLDLKIAPLLLGDDPEQAVAEIGSAPRVSLKEGLPAATAPMAGNQLLMHLSGVGDVRITADNDLQSKYGSPAAEGFEFHFTDPGFGGDIFEYKALALNGAETPWIKNGKFCGSRGHRLPLVGVAIRPLSSKFHCEYQVRFVSGSVSPVAGNGTPLRSQKSADAITQISLKVIAVTENTASAAKPARAAPTPTPKKKNSLKPKTKK